MVVWVGGDAIGLWGWYLTRFMLNFKSIEAAILFQQFGEGGLPQSCSELLARFFPNEMGGTAITAAAGVRPYETVV
jgi:hypothetical protein